MSEELNKIDSTQIFSNKHLLVKTSNIVAIARTNYKLNISEQKILWFAINRVGQDYYKNENSIGNTVNFSIKELCIFYGWKKENLYRKKKITGLTKLDNYISNIRSFGFVIKNFKKDKFDDVGLFNQGGYDKGDIYFHLNRDFLKDHFLDIKDKFILFFLPHTKKFSSDYSITFLRYFKSELFKQTRKYDWTMNDFSAFLQIPPTSSYFKNLADLKRFVLDPVKNDLNNNSDIRMEYKIFKQGRKLDYISFFIEKVFDLVKIKKAQESKETAKILNENKVDVKSNPNFKKGEMSQEEIKKILEEFDNY